jgi:AcrR family transcriptional regulator
MATGPKRRTTRKTNAARGADPRAAIVDALMRLLETKGFGRIGLADVAAEAGVSLADLRDAYDGKVAILADFSRRIDQAVLADGDAEGEGARDRLFDILMRRLDAMEPYRPALRRLARSARCDPGLALALHRIGEKSMMWMLVAAGIHHGGIVGKVAIEGTVLVFAETLNVWLDDDNPGQAKTMAALDKALRRGEQAMGMVNDLCGFVCRLAGAGRRDRDRRQETA